MRKIINSMLEAFDVILEPQLTSFLFKRLLFAILPASVFFYAASRFSWKWGQSALAAVANIWIFIIVVVTAGALCRAVFLKKIQKTDYDLDACHGFAMTFAPAYVVIPVILGIIATILKVISVGALFLGYIPWVGEILLAFIMAPAILIGSASVFLFAMTSFLAPAIIASEEQGVVFTLKRIVSMANYIPVRMIVSFWMAVIIIALFSTAIFSLLYSSVPTLASIGKFIIEDKFANFTAAIAGTFLNLPNKFPGGRITWTYHIAAFFAYIFLGILVSFASTLPLLFTYAITTLIYDQLRKEEIRVKEQGKKPLFGYPKVKSFTSDQVTTCPGCGKLVRGKVTFCTFCGERLKPEEQEDLGF